jgi:hypothetical protein
MFPCLMIVVSHSRARTAPAFVTRRLRVAMQLVARRSAFLALALLASAPLVAAPLAAQAVRVVTLTASSITPFFATISPVVDVVEFHAPTPSEVQRGWTIATTTTVLDDRATLRHEVMIVALDGCAGVRGGDQGDDISGVQWSIDRGATWHDLMTTPRALGLAGATRSSATPAVAHLRYRRRVRASSAACTIRTQLTPVPRR